MKHLTMPGRSVTSQQPNVAIAVPLSNRSELTDDERVSLKHLERHLGSYDISFVAPEGLAFDPRGRRVMRFPRRYFGSAAAHGRLLLSKRFYRAFSEYEYLLIYHLDALVFSDQLAHWCALGYDYVAAPWVEREAGTAAPIGFSRCGNGGFSLRRIDAFMRVIDPPEQHVTADQAWGMVAAGRSRFQRRLLYPIKYLLRLPWLNRSRWVRFLYARNEDRFWSDQAKLFSPGFSVVPPEVGLRFAFDDSPRFCFERSGHPLPFGCHGWNKYDRGFWEAHLQA